MIPLLKLHWQFIKYPNTVIKDNIVNWPIKYGIVIYCLHFASIYLSNNKILGLTSDILSANWGLSGIGYTYLFISVSIGYGVFLQYFITPIFVRWIVNTEKNEFQPDDYRKLIFFSPTAAVIYSVVFILPLSILSSLSLHISSLSILSIILLGLQGILGLWSLVTTVNMFVIQWKGLNIRYNMSGGKIFLALFVIPLVLAIPVLFVYGSDYLTFLKKYTG